MYFFCSSSSRRAERPVWLTRVFFSCLWRAPRSWRTVSAVRLTASSRIEIRSSRCSSNEKLSSPPSSYPSSSSRREPESTSSFWWQRTQNSWSSRFGAPQTWQYILVSIFLRLFCFVRIEALARLASQTAGVDHLDQQGAGAVLGIAEPLLQDLEDV